MCDAEEGEDLPSSSNNRRSYPHNVKYFKCTYNEEDNRNLSENECQVHKHVQNLETIQLNTNQNGSLLILVTEKNADLDTEVTDKFNKKCKKI